MIKQSNSAIFTRIETYSHKNGSRNREFPFTDKLMIIFSRNSDSRQHIQKIQKDNKKSYVNPVQFNKLKQNENEKKNITSTMKKRTISLRFDNFQY